MIHLISSAQSVMKVHLYLDDYEPHLAAQLLRGQGLDHYHRNFSDAGAGHSSQQFSEELELLMAHASLSLMNQYKLCYNQHCGPLSILFQADKSGSSNLLKGLDLLLAASPAFTLPEMSELEQPLIFLEVDITVPVELRCGKSAPSLQSEPLLVKPILKLNRRKGEELLDFSDVTFWVDSWEGPLADEIVGVVCFDSAFLDLDGLILILAARDAEKELVTFDLGIFAFQKLQSDCLWGYDLASEEQASTMWEISRKMIIGHDKLADSVGVIVATYGIKCDCNDGWQILSQEGDKLRPLLE
ncbi:uncharacterized protein G2W53_021881 [Senna tora]|uniref:Uncharacterized protein n=1 Tax=Senna tora TaxID=362788 RepID=A0A834TK75_9FABA|nr:uncharacterized protein G2W53_021881 [Senna tora]